MSACQASTGLDTRQRAEAYVRGALGEHADDHDVEAIADALYDLTGSWDVSRVEHDDFWSVVQRHLGPAVTAHDSRAATRGGEH